MTFRPRIDSWLVLLSCLVLMGVPRVGLAATDAPLASHRLMMTGLLASAEVLDDEQSLREPERYRAPRGLRILTGVGAGLVTSLAGSFVGGVLGLGFCQVTGINKNAFLGCLEVAILGAAVGAVQGYGLGVWWGGEVVGGDGRLLMAMLGVNLGLAVSVALILPNPGNGNLFVVAPLPIMLGAHLGYELSQRSLSPEEPGESELSSRPSVQPVVGFSSHGALLGLGGRF